MSFFLCEIQYYQEPAHCESHICFTWCNVNLIEHVWNIKKFVIRLLYKTREYSDKKKYGEVQSVFSCSLEKSHKSYLFNIHNIFCMAHYTPTPNCCAPGWIIKGFWHIVLGLPISLFALWPWKTPTRHGASPVHIVLKNLLLLFSFPLAHTVNWITVLYFVPWPCDPFRGAVFY